MTSYLTSAAIFETCSGAGDGSNNDFLKCITDQMLVQDQMDRNYSRKILLVLCAALVFFMQAGFAMLCAGAVRRKNVQNTMLKNLLDACGASIAFFVVGYAFAFGNSGNPNPFIGTGNFFLMDVDDLAFWMFQYAFSAASTTIVAGTLAERCQMAAYLCYSVLLAGFVYPVIAHSIWSPFGFLNPLNDDRLFGVGVVDFAGGLVVHVTGGITALFATIILGPRRGRFHDEQGRKLDKPHDFPGHSIALQMLGTLILWFGWYGFNSGSALITPSPDQARLAALAAANTTLSGGMAGLCALFLNYFLLERMTGEPILDLKVAMNGSLAGLVAITAGAGVLEPWAAVFTGAVGGVLYLGGTNLLIKFRLDDAVDAIPVHMVNGIWGIVSVGLFASKRFLELTYGKEMEHVGFFYSFSNGGADARLLAANCVGIVWVCFWVFAIMMPFFIWLDWKGWFRSDPLEEIVGLDTSYHGGLILSGGDDGVNPEYITQFRKQRSELRNRRTGRFSHTTPMEEGNHESVDEGDDDPEGDTDK